MVKYFVLALMGLSMSVFAQSVDVKDVSADDEETTTVEITKGKSKKKSDVAFEVVEGNAPIEGEPSATENDARKAHKVACADWKKELKAENAANGNVVLVSDCGRVTCSGSAGKKICSSEGTYKINNKIQ